MPGYVNSVCVCHPERNPSDEGAKGEVEGSRGCGPNHASAREFSPVRLHRHAGATNQTLGSQHSRENAFRQRRYGKQRGGPSAPRLRVWMGNDSSRRCAQDDSYKRLVWPHESGGQWMPDSARSRHNACSRKDHCFQLLSQCRHRATSPKPSSFHQRSSMF